MHPESGFFIYSGPTIEVITDVNIKSDNSYVYIHGRLSQMMLTREMKK